MDATAKISGALTLPSGKRIEDCCWTPKRTEVREGLPLQVKCSPDSEPTRQGRLANLEIAEVVFVSALRARVVSNAGGGIVSLRRLPRGIW